MEFETGNRYKNFIFKKSLKIDELKATLSELEHEPTGAHVLAINNDDRENLFSLSFKTFPESSNGVPHILEHTVLCGSKKFPVKDPFFSMIRRSLNTFMNAMTGSDFTCYPASSQVETDYFNLLKVYVDAVFHPKLRKESFLQEGWRLEFAEPDDPKSTLLYKGIVFNEMKGALSSAESRIWHEMIKQLTPDLPYAYNSGGDPKEIPNLTYEQLLDFHKTYYHPSRCLFYFYGNIPLEKNLDFIEEEVLKGIKKQPPIPLLPLQKRFSKSKKATMRIPAHEKKGLEEKAFVAIGWLTARLTHQEEMLALSLIDSMLMDTDASPLKRELLKSELSIEVDCLVDHDMSEVPIVFLFKGCSEKNGEKIEKFLLETLEKIAQKPFSSHLIEASLHQLELSRLEITNNHSPFGLTLFMRSALVKQHGCEPESALIVHKLFEKLRLQIKDPNYLTSLLRKYYIDNPHRVLLIAKPDPDLMEEEEREEQKHLEEIRHKMSEEEMHALIRQAQELVAFQKETESQSLDCLPKIELKDVPKEIKNFPLITAKAGELDVAYHDCFTNQILYADFLFDLPYVAMDDIYLLRLLLLLFHEVGAANRNYEENLELLHATTGGIGISCSMHLQTKNPRLMKPSLGIRGKALYRNSGALLTLMKEMLTSFRLDEERRIKEVILQLNNSLENNLNRNALKYAILGSLSPLDHSSAISEAMHGQRFFKKIQEISQKLDDIYPDLLFDLNRIKEQIFSFVNPTLILACDESHYHTLQKEHFYGLSELSGEKYAPWREEEGFLTQSSSLRSLALPVAFTASAYKTISYLHADSPLLTLSTRLMENKILHHKIREVGGAYGSGAHYNSATGNFYFHAYRDPHIAMTLKIFEESIEAISNEEFTSKDLEEAKLGVIQHLDVPLPPATRAITAYSLIRDGREKGLRQSYRDRLLAAKSSDVSRAVRTHLYEQRKESTIISYAGNELIERERDELEKYDLF
jgi:presequence protease